jgi:hypothetical protein
VFSQESGYLGHAEPRDEELGPVLHEEGHYIAGLELGILATPVRDPAWK